MTYYKDVGPARPGGISELAVPTHKDRATKSLVQSTPSVTQCNQRIGKATRHLSASRVTA